MSCKLPSLQAGQPQRCSTLVSMNQKLTQLTQRIKVLEALADEVGELALKQCQFQDVQPNLNVKGQRWYRGARELLVQQESSGRIEFDREYHQRLQGVFTGNPYRLENAGDFGPFIRSFRAARALLMAVVDEIESRELPLKTQLSFAVSADEFDRALELVSSSRGDEAILRAGGVVARVALERHLWTVIESRSIAVVKNPPHKKKADTQDLLTTLVKESIMTATQKSEMDSLFAVGNNCAHPKEAVAKPDVERLIRRGRELASMIL